MYEFLYETDYLGHDSIRFLSQPIFTDITNLFTPPKINLRIIFSPREIKNTTCYLNSEPQMLPIFDVWKFPICSSYCEYEH